MKNITAAKKQKKIRGLHFNCSEFLLDNDFELYVEDYFHELIAIERKRAERSKRPFILVLFDLFDLAGDAAFKDAARTVADILSRSTRETDLRGWYRNHHVIGVILTDVANDWGAVREKLNRSIREKAGIGSHLEKVKVTFHPFPEARSAPFTPLDPALYPDLAKKKSRKSGYLKLKRIVDLLGAAAAIALLLPLFLIISVLIKLTSKGPVLFRQTRLGEFGAPFVFLKFRSMYTGSDEEIHSQYVKSLITEEKAYEEGASERVYKIKDDPRVTPLGRFLRKTSLDELPQFYNVLTGEMSLVGPRPPIPYELESYHAWHMRRIQEVKPGITGLWQVKGRSRTTFNEMVRMDLDYIENRSILLDLKLIFMTPWSVLRSKGAY